MYVSSNMLDAEARQKAKDEADGVRRVGLSPAAIKRRLAKKKAEAREAKKAGQ